MVSELIRKATRQQYEIQGKNLDHNAPAASGIENDGPLADLRCSLATIPADIAFFEAEKSDLHSTQASQISLTQDEDEHMRKLDRSGALVQIVGSQSLLSQELVDCSQKNEPLLSQPTFDTTSMAKKLGLLEEEDEAEDDKQAAAVTTSTEIWLAASQSQVIDASQISLDLSQSFGTLLSAAQTFHEQEEAAKLQSTGELPEFMDEYHDPRLIPQEGFDTPPRHLSQRQKNNSSSKKMSKVVVRKPVEALSSSKKRKNVSAIAASAGGSKKAKFNSTRHDDSATILDQPTITARCKAQLMAKQAADLAEQAITNPEVAKRLLLTMALVRVNPRSAPEKMPGKGHIIPEGFHWAQYPPLEGVLKEQMSTYYDLSTTKCQSAQQQAFNNDLVFLVRQAADEHGWLFYESFTDKVLRDRVRCYYKTHIQNAKKRLNTMVRNPTKKANARHLSQHLHIIKKVKEIRVEDAVLENEPFRGTEDKNHDQEEMVPETPTERDVCRDDEHCGSDEENVLESAAGSDICQDVEHSDAEEDSNEQLDDGGGSSIVAEV